MSSPPPTLDALLAASRATDAFRADLLAYAAFEESARVVVGPHAPRVKVLRVLSQLLSAEPDLAIDAVRVRGATGCSDFRGTITVTAAGVEREWEFVWDCRWRARESAIVDAYGRPDQARAAREFGWCCFAVWRERVPARAAAR